MKHRILGIAALILSALLSVAHAATVNLNTASAEELAAALQGIGVTKAEAIIAFREKNGVFLSVDDLALVKGIGDALLERNRDSLIVE